VVIVLLASELLCLNVLSEQRSLDTGESDLVAGVVMLSGIMVLYRVGEPLVTTTVTHRVGKRMVVAFAALFGVLVVLHVFRLVSGSASIVIFASCALVFGVIVPGLLNVHRIGVWMNGDDGHVHDSAPDEEG
jgi:hypothetical protein